MLSNLLRAAVAITLTPVAVVADVLTLPSTAYGGKPAFGMTSQLLRSAGQNVAQATRPKD